MSHFEQHHVPQLGKALLGGSGLLGTGSIGLSKQSGERRSCNGDCLTWEMSILTSARW
jgi:hypothetical protein